MVPVRKDLDRLASLQALLGHQDGKCNLPFPKPDDAIHAWRGTLTSGLHECFQSIEELFFVFELRNRTASDFSFQRFRFPLFPAPQPFRFAGCAFAIHRGHYTKMGMSLSVTPRKKIRNLFTTPVANLTADRPVIW